MAATRVSIGSATASSTTVHFDTDHLNGVESMKTVPLKTLRAGLPTPSPGSSIPVPLITSGRGHHGECVTEHSKGKCRIYVHCSSHTSVTPVGSAVNSLTARNTVDRTNVSTVTFNSSLSTPSNGATAYEICKHSRCDWSDCETNEPQN